jgi:hypothetical protein
MKVRPATKPGSVSVEMNRWDEALLAQPAAPPLAIKRILVPVDFSEFSYKSLDYANAFAVRSGAEVLLFTWCP